MKPHELKKKPHQLKKNEFALKVMPIAINYRCELCGNGTMFYQPDTDKEYIKGIGPKQRIMFPHKCDECNGEMSLPMMYPYIKWIPTDEPIPTEYIIPYREDDNNDPTGIHLGDENI